MLADLHSANNSFSQQRDIQQPYTWSHQILPDKVKCAKKKKKSHSQVVSRKEFIKCIDVAGLDVAIPPNMSNDQYTKSNGMILKVLLRRLFYHSIL